MSRGLLSVWAPPTPRALLGRQFGSLPYPLEEPGCRRYEWGRDGLWRALRATALEPGDEILVPAYHHGSEVAAITDCGFVPRFYEATTSLEPDPVELEDAIGPRTRGLYLIHYLGFGLDARRWRRWCDERGMLLIEDVAMAWLAERDGKPLGTHGDISFFSLWKSHGLPDGGAVICRGATPDAPPSRRSSLGAVLHCYLRWTAQRSRLLSALRRRRGPGAWDPAADFTARPPGRGPSRISLRMLAGTDSAAIPAIRRRHHAALVARLAGRVPEPFGRIDPESSPFAVPVTSADPVGLVAHLRERDIDATWFWSVAHPLLPADEYPAAAERRRSVVLLPIHQGLDPHDVERIATAVLEFEREESMGSSEKAPDFSLPGQDGEEVSLRSLAGQRVVLYFYPEADTPGCTAQACGIRDHQADLAARGAVAIGISPDSPEKLAAFAGRYGLPFKLLADVDESVARSYGAWKRRRRPPFQGETLRSTFLIGADGSLERVFEGVDPATHDQLVLDALDEAPA